MTELNSSLKHAWRACLVLCIFVVICLTTILSSLASGSSTEVRLTQNPASDWYPSWSPDGSRIAYTSNRDGNDEIYVMSSDGSGQTRLTNNSAGDIRPIWSPNNSKIAFESFRDGNSEIYTMNADGSGQTRLTYTSTPEYRPAWSPDGSQIAFDDGSDVYMMNVDGSGRIVLSNSSGNDWAAAWAPDGSQIVFNSTRDGNNEIYKMKDDGTGQTRLTISNNEDMRPAWSYDGTRIAFDSSRDGNYELYVMNADGSGQTRLTSNAANEIRASWSPNNLQLVFDSSRDGNSEIYKIDVPNISTGPFDMPNEVRLTSNTANDTWPSWSPDSSRLAFASDRSGSSEIYIMNSDGASQARITNNLFADGKPAWSPAGNRIAFESIQSGNTDIYVMNTDGSNQIRLTSNSAIDGWPSWSPDSSKLVFSSNREGNYKIFVMSADGSNQVRLTNSASPDYKPTWSPDGSRIAFLRDSDIYVVNSDGSGLVQLTFDAPSDYQPSWSPDSSKLVFTSNRDGNLEIYTMNADGSEQTRITNSYASDFLPCWSPDGKSIAFASNRDGQYEIYRVDYISTAPVTDPPPAPVLVSPSNVATVASNAPINLDWNDVPSADYYYVDVYDIKGYQILSNRVSSSTFSISSGVLQLNKKYSWIVRAYNAAGYTTSSQWTFFTDSDDIDGDALKNAWEVLGIDSNSDGDISDPNDVNLPAMGADPGYKDIFVEVDYLEKTNQPYPSLPGYNHTHKLKDGAAKQVINAFLNSPVDNPNEQTGIHLHIDNGSDSEMNPLTHQRWGSLSKSNLVQEIPNLEVIGDFYGLPLIFDWTEFRSIKISNLSPERKKIFHHAFMAHTIYNPDPLSNETTVGKAEVYSEEDPANFSGSAFMLGLNIQSEDPMFKNFTEYEQASTFMHELGHNLGLHHGGEDDINRKPNYISIMNYTYQDWYLNYSPIKLLAINELDLMESAGVQDANSAVRWFCNGIGQSNEIPSNGVDWNCDGSISSNPIHFIDVNKDNIFFSLLNGYNDWPNLKFNGGGVGGDLEAPQPAFDPVEITERSPVEITEVRRPYKVNVNGPSRVTGAPGTIIDASFEVGNNGEKNDTYTISLNSQNGWIESETYSVSIPIGTSISIPVSISIPQNGFDSGEMIYLTATSNSNADVTDSGEVMINVCAKPTLVLNKLSVFWASYADYISRNLTVNWQIANISGTPAYGVNITSISNSDGVETFEPIPVSFGDIFEAGSGKDASEREWKFTVPGGVGSWRSVLTGSAQDACGNTYIYP